MEEEVRESYIDHHNDNNKIESNNNPAIIVVNDNLRKHNMI